MKRRIHFISKGNEKEIIKMGEPTKRENVFDEKMKLETEELFDTSVYVCYIGNYIQYNNITGVGKRKKGCELGLL